MKPMLKRGKSAFWAGLLGTVLLLAGPAPAHADQGKWWTPREGRARGEHRVWRPSPRYGRVYRDVFVLRGAWGGPYAYRAHRYWVRPWYRGPYLHVRPVRYFVAADAVIGGLRISARFHPRDRWMYGCNFCDACFDDYDHWAAHVGTCPRRPDGYRVRAERWEDEPAPYADSNHRWYPDG
jgi:hypothetical protein